MGATIDPPAYPGAEIEEGGAEIVMATILEFYLFSTHFCFDLFLTTISSPPPNSGVYPPTHLTETSSRQTYHKFAVLTFYQMADCGRMAV